MSSASNFNLISPFSESNPDPQRLAKDAGFELKHFAALDGLRGLACLMVVALHYELPAYGGFFGVDIFFVLSGFLITAVLVREWDRTGSIDLLNFYVRRTLRLFPALLLFLAVSMTFSATYLSRAEYRDVREGALVALAGQTNNPFALSSLKFLPFLHTWSLSIEDKFYLVWPLALCALLSQRRLSRRAKIGVVVAAIIGSALFRARMFHVQPIMVGAWYCDALCRTDSMLVGCLIAMLATWNMLPATKWFASTINVVGQVFVAVLGYLLFYGNHLAPHLYYGSFTLIAFGVAVVILSLIRSKSGVLVRILEQPFFTQTGRLSYGLYLWHLPILLYFKTYHHQCTGQPNYVTGASSHWYLLGIFATSVGFSLISYVCVEKPLLMLRPKSADSASSPKLSELTADAPPPPASRGRKCA